MVRVHCDPHRISLIRKLHLDNCTNERKVRFNKASCNYGNVEVRKNNWSQDQATKKSSYKEHRVAALIEEAFPALQGKVELNWVGKQIGSHTGPGTVALFFRGTERE